MSKQALALPKPKEHGAWGMLYIPLAIAVGISGAWNVRVLLMILTVTLMFLSQRPYSQLLTNRTIRQNGALFRTNLIWLAVYWTASASLTALLYFHYRLEDLPQFAWIGVPVAAAFTWFLKTNRMRTVAGELAGICGLTLTAPLAHYAGTGHLQPVGFWLWGLCILYFASSVFYVKAVVANSVKARSQSRFEPVYYQLCASYHLGLLVLMSGLAALDLAPPILLLAFLPVVTRGLLGIRTRRGKLNFARIGWTEVGYSLFFALLTTLAIRGLHGPLPL
jgi:YwiC-like protein